MDLVINITTILGNIITILGFSSVIFFMINYFKGKTYLIIYLDYYGNLITTRKKIENIIIKLIKSPESFKNIRVIKKINREMKKSMFEVLKLDSSLINNPAKKTIISKYYELNDNRVNELIRRGLNLLTSRHIFFLLLGSINIIDIVIEYINLFYRFNNLRYDRIVKMHIPIDDYKLFSVLYLTEDDFNSIMSNTKKENDIYYLNENNEKANYYLFKVALPTIIFMCSENDKFWNGDIFIAEDKILSIFDNNKWSFT